MVDKINFKKKMIEDISLGKVLTFKIQKLNFTCPDCNLIYNSMECDIKVQYNQIQFYCPMDPKKEKMLGALELTE